MMDLKKLAALASILLEAKDAGLSLIGGAKALASLFGQDLTAEEQTAIELAVMMDARRRRDESLRMAAPD